MFILIMLLHTRTRALKACGHASWRKCESCGCYDHVDKIHKYGDGYSHKDCYNSCQRQRYARKKEIARGNDTGCIVVAEGCGL